MKYFILLFIFISFSSHGCNDGSFDLYQSLKQVHRDQFAPVIKNLIDTEANLELQTHSTDKLKFAVVSHQGDVFKVFGFSEKEALDFVGDRFNERACSPDHIHDDLANRWCHGAVVKIIDETLKSYGVNKLLSGLVSASVFLPKEYLIDLHPSKADLVIADFEMFKIKDPKGDLKGTITMFGDGVVFLNFNKRF